METITTHDVSINGVLFIMELILNHDGTSYMTLTEACNHPKADTCDHITYDFTEVY